MQNFAYLRACKIFLSTKCKQGSNNQKNNYWVSKRFFGELNSQAVGMDSWVQLALKSILRGDPIFESAAWLFVIILKFIFTSIFEIKIHDKKI